MLFVSRANVSGPDVGPLGLVSQVALPKSVARPGRLTLWRTALRMLARYPVTGVGPDNYRLMYGTYAGLGEFDTRVHTNNMYLEMLVGGGIVGGLAFAWLCWRACGQFVAAARPAGDTSLALLGIGVLAAGAAVAIHGFVDSFLSFTATYILIAVTLGLASACAAINQSHAHRV
jgi:O-antigen ligase